MNDKSNTMSMDLLSKLRALDKNIWVLSLVSCLMHASSLVLTAMGPDIIATIFGKGDRTVGYIRGLADALSHVMKLFSGPLSDGFGKRKFFVAFGEACCILTKPLMAIATIFQLFYMYAGLYLIERIANGLRDSPRDAMIADVTDKSLRGVAFGVRNLSAAFGCVLGAAMCLLCLYFCGGGNDTTKLSVAIKYILFYSAVVATIAACFVVFGLRETKVTKLAERATSFFAIRFTDLKFFRIHYWIVILGVLFFTCGRFSDSFITLKAKKLGLSTMIRPILILIYSLTNSVVTMTIGMHASSKNRGLFVVGGACCFIISAVLITRAQSTFDLVLASIFYGAHYGFYYANLNTIIANFAPIHIRGTAFGIFNLMCAFGALISNACAGSLWAMQQYALSLGVCVVFMIGSSFIFLYIDTIKNKEEN